MGALRDGFRHSGPADAGARACDDDCAIEGALAHVLAAII
jgi:hypothetical protein